MCNCFLKSVMNKYKLYFRKVVYTTMVVAVLEKLRYISLNVFTDTQTELC